MHLHHRVLGLVDRRFEHRLVALHLPGRGVGTGCGIVVDVAVERPQLIGEAAQHGRRKNTTRWRSRASRIAVTVAAGRSPDSRTPWISAPIAGVIGRTSRAASVAREELIAEGDFDMTWLPFLIGRDASDLH